MGQLLNDSTFGCKDTLQRIFEILKNQKQKEQFGVIQSIRRFELQQLLRTNQQLREQLMQTSLYVGYKLLWIIQLFLDGKVFPRGELPEEQWQMCCADIFEFVNRDEILESMILFDPQAFFSVVTKLFCG